MYCNIGQMALPQIYRLKNGIWWKVSGNIVMVEDINESIHLNKKYAYLDNNKSLSFPCWIENRLGGLECPSDNDGKCAN